MHYLRWRRWGDPLGGRTPNGEQSAFLDKSFAEATPSGCQFWPYMRDPNGYGRLTSRGGTRLVHRQVCEMAYGPPPDDGQKYAAAHSCGNGHLGCFNKHHLRWATYSGNEIDKLKHGTHNRGERHGLHKMTVEKVRLVREIFDRRAMTNQQMADAFGISVAQVSRIGNRVDWSWLDA